METTIKISKKSVYGNDLIYPACETSKLLISLMGGKKTFSNDDLVTIKKLGYTIINN